MKFLITALGSYGDVHPMVGLGATLQSRGHRAAIITNPHFQKMVESMGIEFLPLGTDAEYHELAHHPDLWNPMKGPPLIMRLMVQSLRELYRLIDANVDPGETVLVAHVFDFASRTHHELHGTPMASVHFAPVGLRSFDESPQMFRMLMQPWLPKWFRRFQYWLADKVVDHLIAGEINCTAQRSGPAAGEAGHARVVLLAADGASACSPSGLPRRNPIGHRIRGSPDFRCGTKRSTRSCHPSRRISCQPAMPPSCSHRVPPTPTRIGSSPRRSRRVRDSTGEGFLLSRYRDHIPEVAARRRDPLRVRAVQSTAATRCGARASRRHRHVQPRACRLGYLRS